MPESVAAEFQRRCAQDQGDDALYLPHWTSGDWALLFAHTVPATLAAGDVLIRQGEPAGALYFVASGAMELRAGLGHGAELGELYREPPGSVIGEISFFDGRPRTATVWAVEPTELRRLDHAALAAFSEACPRLAHDLLMALGRVLAFRLRRTDEVRLDGILR